MNSFLLNGKSREVEIRRHGTLQACQQEVKNNSNAPRAPDPCFFHYDRIFINENIMRSLK